MVPGYGPITTREVTDQRVDDLYVPLSLISFWKFRVNGRFEEYGDSYWKLVSQEALLDDSWIRIR